MGSWYETWCLFKQHWQATVIYWTAYFTAGLTVSFLGPTMLDLRCQTRSSLEQMAWAFFGQAGCMLLGNLLAGVFIKRISPRVILLIATFVISLLFACVPLCNEFVELVITLALLGLAMGCIEPVSNQELLNIYNKYSLPIMQALHFWMGFGAFVSPLIAESFLTKENCLVMHKAANNYSDPVSLRIFIIPHQLGSHGQYSLPFEGDSTSRISYAFLIMAAINLIVPLTIIVLLVRGKCSKSEPLLESDKTHLEMDFFSEPMSLENPHQPDFCFRNIRFTLTIVLTHILGTLILVTAEGTMAEYASMVDSFGVMGTLQMTPNSAALLTSLFWGMFALGRLLSIPASTVVQGHVILIFCWVGSVISAIIVLIASSSVGTLYVATAFLGLSLSSIFPTLITFVEDMLHFQGSSVTLLIMGATIGEMSFPVIVGSVMEKHGYDKFHYCTLFFTMTGLVSFLLLLLCRHFHLRTQTENDKDQLVGEKELK